MYRVIAEPLVSIGDVKSSMMTFPPGTTPSRKIRCSLDSSYGTRTPSSAAAGGGDNFTPFNDTFEIVESFSCPAIFRQSRIIGAMSPLCGDADEGVRVPAIGEGVRVPVEAVNVLEDVAGVDFVAQP